MKDDDEEKIETEAKVWHESGGVERGEENVSGRGGRDEDKRKEKVTGKRMEEKVENNGGRWREVQNRRGISREGYE